MCLVSLRDVLPIISELCRKLAIFHWGRPDSRILW